MRSPSSHSPSARLANPGASLTPCRNPLDLADAHAVVLIRGQKCRVVLVSLPSRLHMYVLTVTVVSRQILHDLDSCSCLRSSFQQHDDAQGQGSEDRVPCQAVLLKPKMQDDNILEEDILSVRPISNIESIGQAPLPPTIILNTLV